MNRVKKLGKQTFSALKVRNYRLYFIGQAISLSGTWMQTIGQGLLVLQLTHSGTALGLVTALQFLPILLFGPLGGVVADRFNKRRILYLTQTAAGLLALILGLLVAFGLIQVWMIYILALMLGFVNTFDNPTRQTFVLEMVGKDELPNAVALNSSEVNLARVIGPSIAGILIATTGLAVCFIFNGLSYIAVLIVLYMMREKELHLAPPSTRSPGQLREGLRYVSSTPVLRNTLIMMAIIGTLSYEFQVILPLFAEYTFHSNAGGYAALMSAMGVGAVAGGLFTANRRKTTPQMLVSAVLLFGVTLLVAAFMPTMSLALLAMIFVGVFSINFTALGNVTLQLESAPEMRGRVMSLWTMAFLGSTPIGGPIIGWIGEHVGPRWGLGLGGLAAIVAASIGALTIQKVMLPAAPVPFSIGSSEEDVEKNAKIL